MTVRVNLLPAEYAERLRVRNVAVATGAGFVGFLLILALVYVLALGAVNAARDERDEEAAELARLRAREQELAPFRALANALEARNASLAVAMGGEVSWATVMNDLALTFPANSTLTSLTLSSTAAAPTATGAAEDVAVGSVTFAGYSVDRYAPGVEVMLLQFEKILAFFDVYLSSATKPPASDVATFDAAAELNQRALTGRYASGLPEDLR